MRCAPDAGWKTQLGQHKSQTGLIPREVVTGGNLVGASQFRSHSHLAINNHDHNPPRKVEDCRRWSVDETGCAPDAGWKKQSGQHMLEFSENKSRTGLIPRC
jgi:hypothetical protein